ncbi:MAG: hypothetical protein ACQET4_10855, partial [Pseudomonadota bacterium]
VPVAFESTIRRRDALPPTRFAPRDGAGCAQLSRLIMSHDGSPYIAVFFISYGTFGYVCWRTESVDLTPYANKGVAREVPE